MSCPRCSPAACPLSSFCSGAFCLSSKRSFAHRSTGFALQRSFGCSRTISGHSVPWLPTGSFILLCLSSDRGRTFRGRKFHPSSSRLRESNCDGLLRGSRPVFAFSNVMNFLAHEFSCLGRRRFPLTRIFTRSFHGFLVGHDKISLLCTLSKSVNRMAGVANQKFTVASCQVLLRAWQTGQFERRKKSGKQICPVGQTKESGRSIQVIRWFPYCTRFKSPTYF